MGSFDPLDPMSVGPTFKFILHPLILLHLLTETGRAPSLVKNVQLLG